MRGTIARAALAGLLVAALGAAGCGRKGPLEPPPSAAPTAPQAGTAAPQAGVMAPQAGATASPAGTTAPRAEGTGLPSAPADTANRGQYGFGSPLSGQDTPKVTSPPEPRQDRFFLDFLL